ncbi:hypothetical protein Ancab_025458 [Ancistrocladus abbreviatus]
MRIGSRVIGGEKPKNGEKETTVAEQDERARFEKGMPIDVEKGCFITDLIVGDKATEERWIEGPNKTLKNQTKGDKLETTATGPGPKVQKPTSVKRGQMV